jgi:diaminohydroxyphosphoribosylaminopyrimidine deaminase/5-amino-6-(5-phosphoribosylamino)uracil reductase
MAGMKAESAMRLALALGRRARGRAHPNPCVGAIVYRGDRVLGRGYTRPVGGPHAEVVAIRAALRRFGARSVRGASLAVTLEPCCHLGRTGPCTREIIDAGIGRVVVGHRDPHREVAGRGLRALRRAGVEVELGVLAAECRRLHRGFLSVCERGRPFVSLKLASTLDGRIATASGESRWITSEASRAVVQRMRAASDGILVGSETAVMDDPELVARRNGRVVHRPVRVLVDSRLRVPPESKVFRSEAAGTWVLCSPQASPRRRRVLAATGAQLLDVRPRGRHLDLGHALKRLARSGLTEVLVEGGGRLAAALLREGLVDEVHWFAAPKLLGGDARPALAALDIAALRDLVALENVVVRRCGDDVHVCGDVPRRSKRSRSKGPA